MRITVDCHMLGAPSAGDAGNGRYAQMLSSALAATAEAGDGVVALISHPAAREQLDGVGSVMVAEGGARRLLLHGPGAMASLGAAAGFFHYVGPPRPTAPVLLIVHDASFIHDPQWMSRRAARMLRALVPRSVRRAARVIAVSATAAADVSAALAIPAERIDIVMTHAAPAFRPREDARARIADRLGLTDFVLAVGDLGPRKNIPALADAVSRLGGPELAIVGRPGHGGRNILAEAGGRWLGPVDDELLAELYGAASAVAVPSLYEGFGITALEALACGAPVVVSDRGALPEVVAEAGIVVEPTPSALAEGLAAALEPATGDRLRDAGPERARRFSRDATGRAGWAAVRRAVG